MVNSKKKTKILLIGGYGYADIGDESMLTSDLIYLKKYFENAELLALSSDPHYTKQYHGVESDYSIGHKRKTYNTSLNKIVNIISLPLRIIEKILNVLSLTIIKKRLFCTYEIRENIHNAVNWTSLYILSFIYKFTKGRGVLNKVAKKDLDLIFKSDLIFNVGGGNLNSIYKKELYKKCLVYLLAKNFNKPVIVSGQTIGPLYGKFESLVLGWALNSVNLVTLRDKKHSLSVLRQINVNKTLIEETIDDAFNLPLVSQTRKNEIFIKENVNHNDIYVGINIGNWNNTPLDKYINVLSKICKYCISALKFNIVLIPMQYKKSSDDRIPLLRLRDTIDKPRKVKIIVNEYNDRELKTIISKMKIAIGSRYHFLVFSTTAEVPSIGMVYNDYYYRKIHGIMHMMGQEKYILNTNEFSFETIKKQLDQLLRTEAKVKDVLKNRKEMLSCKSLLSFEKAKELLTKYEE